MQCNVSSDARRDGRAVVISVTGELDLATSPTLEQTLKRTESSDAELVILDLGELEFIDSSGISVLVRVHMRAADDDRRFALAKISPRVQPVLSLVGLTEQLTLAATVEELLDEH